MEEEVGENMFVWIKDVVCTIFGASEINASWSKKKDKHIENQLK